MPAGEAVCAIAIGVGLSSIVFGEYGDLRPGGLRRLSGSSPASLKTLTLYQQDQRAGITGTP